MPRPRVVAKVGHVVDAAAPAAAQAAPPTARLVVAAAAHVVRAVGVGQACCKLPTTHHRTRRPSSRIRSHHRAVESTMLDRGRRAGRGRREVELDEIRGLVAASVCRGLCVSAGYLT
eukprot:3937770-Rhodomonas_salina.1